MISRRSFGLLALSAGCRRKTSTGYDVYIANETGKAVAVVDLTSFSVSHQIALDDSPTAVIAPQDGGLVYALAPRTGSIYQIDTETSLVTGHIRLGPSIMMRAAGESIWVLGKRSLTEVSRAGLQRKTTLPLPLDAHDFDLSNDTGLASVSYGRAGSLSVIELEKREVKAPVKISDGIGAVRFRQDGKGLFAADTASRQLCVMDQAANMVVRLPIAVRPDNLCFNPNGGQLFVTGEGQDAVVVIFPYYVPQVAETILAGHAPGAMAASATHLFLANPQSGHVTILGIAQRKILAVAAVGAEPGFIALTPDGNYALVLNRRSGDMAVILTSEIVGVGDRRKSAALFTMIPVGARPVSAAVRAV